MVIKKKYTLIFSLIFIAAFAANPFSVKLKPVVAWSGDTHGWLAEVSIRMMPSPWDERLNENLQYFLDHSRDPDSERSTYEDSDPVAFAKEEPCHYVDADVRPELYPYNADNHPQPTFNMIKNMYDPQSSSDYQLGVACWAVENWTRKLTEDLQIYDWDDDIILRDLTWLAHYVQDSWMPFHAVSFFEGQKCPRSGDNPGLYYKGGQDGIHGFIEQTVLQIKYKTEITGYLDEVTGTAKYRNPFLASLDGILTGEKYSRQLLDIKDVQGYTMGSSDWTTAVWDTYGGSDGMLMERLINATIATADVWYTAFVDADLIYDPEHSPTTEVTTTTTIDTTTTTTAASTGFQNIEIILIISLLMVTIPTLLRRRKK